MVSHAPPTRDHELPRSSLPGPAHPDLRQARPSKFRTLQEMFHFQVCTEALPVQEIMRRAT